MDAKRYGTIFAIAAMTSVLAACGSDSETNVAGTDFAGAVGAGRDLSFSQSIVRTSYPDACSLIPEHSIQVLVEAPVVAHRTISGCAWSTGRASLPTVVATFVEIGEDSAQAYERRSTPEDSITPKAIGDQARMSRTNQDMTTRIDVLKANAFFRVEDRITSTSQSDLRQADRVSTRVATLIAEQISGSPSTAAQEDTAQGSTPGLAQTGSPTLALLSIGVLALVAGAALTSAGARRI